MIFSFDTRTNSGPNFALNYPDGYDNLYVWTGGGYTGIEGIYINGSLQTIDGAYSGNFGSKVGGDNTTRYAFLENGNAASLDGFYGLYERNVQN